MYYVLEGRNVRKVEPGEWSPWFEANFNHRNVGKTQIGSALVSTVFLGLDHNYHGNGPPILFETMVFDGPFPDEQWRYSTYDEAESGHEMVCELVRENMRQG